MLDYKKLKNSELSPWPNLTELPFVKVTSGEPQHQGRHDIGDFTSRLQVGVWECTPGTFEYTYPGDEICTLVSGSIDITDSQGDVHTFSAGDTFFTEQGETVTWQINETVRKVFQIHNKDV